MEPVTLAEPAVDERHVLASADLAADEQRVDHRDLEGALVAEHPGAAEEIVGHVRLAIRQRPDGIVGVALPGRSQVSSSRKPPDTADGPHGDR